jgi:LysM repeat protein
LSTTRLKGHVGIVVAGMVLAVVLAALSILAVLPGTAQAQEEEAEAQEDTGPTASVEAEQNSITNENSTTNEKGASATTRLVVEPGDSLWSISEEHLGPGATPEQTAYEVQRIFELNRDQIGENPNLIFPGQEFFLVSAAPGGAAAAPEQPVAVAEQQQAPEPLVVESEGVSDSPAGDIAWVEDGPPEGARLSAEGDDEWKTVDSDPTPFSGTTAHQSNIVDGLHQHFFEGASAPLSVNRGERLFAYVYLDPANMPEEVMLQWNDGSWEHRAYWGADKIEWGQDGTESRRYMGPLPPGGQWVRLEVAASEVGLEDREVNGMAFTLYGGRATWDVAGKAGSETAVAESKSEGGVSQDYAVPAEQRTDSTDEQAESAPAESAPAESAPARRLLGVGILALTLIVALLMAWRLPLRRKVEDPQAWRIPQQDYYEKYASHEAPRQARPETANGAEEDVVAESSDVAEGDAVAASALGQERLKRVRHLRRIRQRRSPGGWRGG